jgi:hypothetical protein
MILNSNATSCRRLLGLATVAGLAASLTFGTIVAKADTQAPGEMRFSSISVDTQGLADRGLSNYAVRVAKEAQPIVQKVFADRLAPGTSAPRLVLKINEILLSSDADAPGGSPFGPGSENDFISGVGEVVDGHGHVIETKPIETSATPFGGEGPDIVYLENLRTKNLISTMAEWIKREI